MLNKIFDSLSEAVCDVKDGCTILIGGFGNSGIPDNLIAAVVAKGVKDLTIITNNAGSGDSGVASLLKKRIVKKIVTSYPRSRGSIWFEELYKTGEIELELLPQGNLTEKVRAAGAGIGAFYTPIGVGTLLGKDKEQKMINGKLYQLEYPLFADVALISAKTADRWGNLVYSTTARNFGPSMAMAGKVTVVEVLNIVELGQLDPEVVITPGIFVDKVVKVTR